MAAVPIDTPDAAALQRWLFEARGIEVPVTRLAGLGGAATRHFVRVSVQAYNDEADLAALDAALAEAGV